ncbi:MAG: 1-acyl-sn-glycerol-3-phosphate acyltransferase [Bacteroides sp.]|nr:1-acyl-sn-glycerol-3-phosphate acyltransferase [Bacteroides sp.]MCM1084870.1 1-acyl-sn-glycerol-3-phosphate acyltransferase [Bacteroides sp.]
MTRFVLSVYDFFESRKRLLFGLLLLVTAMCFCSVFRLRFTEDITAFLPGKSLVEKQIDSLPFGMENALLVGVRQKDTIDPNPEQISRAIEYFLESLPYGEGTPVQKIVGQVDPEQWSSLTRWFLDRLPLLLTEKDYAYFDSVLSVPYVKQKMEDNRLLLLSPAGLAMHGIISSDPIGFSAPVWQHLQEVPNRNGYEVYQGILFSPERREGVISIESAYSVSDVEGNTLLLKLIDSVARQTEAYFDDNVSFHTFGAAEIAITNTNRIKKDSALSVAIAITLIVSVLIFSIWSVRGILLMVVSLVFGCLFSLGLLGVFKNEVSWIAVGASSIIIGIALNYPLHLILHHRQGGNIREVLREMVPPLTTGNITTVVAFMSLLLVDAPAMQDMGLFASFLLLGVIFFVLFFLPHMLPFCCKNAIEEKSGLKDDGIQSIVFASRQKNVYRRSRLWLIIGILATLILGMYSQNVSFESDMQKINYMTAGQRQDMKRYANQSDMFADLLPDTVEQQHRLELWRNLIAAHSTLFDSVQQLGIEAGFSQEAFASFYQIIQKEYLVQAPFNARTMLQTMVSSLANDFNYVLFVCGFFVFVFLCIMLGRVELGIIAFLPLTIGWIWILGIMGMANIHFNIVNIILATLIFGQGDDYTIFITEGLMYEHAYGKKVVKHYSKSIVLSSVIMFLGIGALIFSKHPAMRSLAEVTFIGMGVVVLMAFVIPSVIFKWLVSTRYEKRRTPITLVNLLASIYSIVVFVSISSVGVLVGFFLFRIGKPTDRKKEWYHKSVYRVMRFSQRNIPRIKITIQGSENLQRLNIKPSVIICNHHSQLDLMCALALHPKLIILTKDWVVRAPIYGSVSRYADFYSVNDKMESTLPKLEQLVKKGYSIMVFPEGTRAKEGKIERFHSGAFYLAQCLGLDILPVVMHGSGHVLPKHEHVLRKGEIHIKIHPPVEVGSTMPIEAAREMRNFYRQEYAAMVKEIETVSYFFDTVFLNFAYKGMTVAKEVRKEYKQLCKTGKMDMMVNNAKGIVFFEENGYGLYSFFYALVNKETQVEAVFVDKEKARMLSLCAMRPENLMCKF